MNSEEPKNYVMDMNEPEEQKVPSTRKCLRPPVNVSKSERMEIHRLKMTMKKMRNRQFKPTGFGLPVRANRSKRWDEVETDGSQPNSAK